MSITDELREYANIATDRDIYAGARLLKLADRIDERHERAMADAELAAAPTEAQLDELGYVKLPVDAVGVPIHVGDRLDGYNRTITVQELRWNGDYRWDVVDEYGDEWHDNYAFTHHHAPTVEDVLREFGDWYAHTKGGCDEDGILAEYAAKLRLAEEVDE